MANDAARMIAQEFAERIADIGPIEVRRFFSGAGIVAGGVQFAFVLGGTLYLRVDNESRPEFESRGARPFSYGTRARTVKVASYFELPESVAEDGELLRAWARRSLHAAAIVQRSRKKPKATARPRKKASQS